MKVIFLDFDGVLNSADFRDSVDDYYHNFIDETRMPVLSRIVRETGAVIVLSTTWKVLWDKDVERNTEDGRKIDEIFGGYGLEIFSKTECADDDRNFEIFLWLCNHEVENYVILDDLDFRWSDENRRHFVMTYDDRCGLDEDAADRAIKILKRS